MSPRSGGRAANPWEEGVANSVPRIPPPVLAVLRQREPPSWMLSRFVSASLPFSRPDLAG